MGIIQGKVSIIGHILRHGGFTQLIVEGTVEEMRTRSRPRYTQTVNDVTTNTNRKGKGLAQDRRKWRATTNQS